MRLSRLCAAILLSVGLLSACGKASTENQVIIGTIAGPESELMATVKQVAADEYNLDVKIVEFNDYSLPNQALADGSIDANMFQHEPYLETAMKAKKYHFGVLGSAFIYPMGIYSTKHKKLADIPNGAIVAIPNDPSNEARALLLLKQAKLITLKPHVGTTATLQDIDTNPKQLQIKELDAAQLPRALDDVDFAAINTNYAMLAGLMPSTDAFVLETSSSPYANVVVVRGTELKQAKFITLMKALHSKPVIDKAAELFKGQAIIGW
ncbi:MAG: MetQ/NlpA family ABC transporter substrate-binding protein [Pseudomonadota bacterium]|nr:MetQ/NlpA family ABC transporter substrate-binding protein [Pseudomonadota bacterium]